MKIDFAIHVVKNGPPQRLENALRIVERHPFIRVVDASELNTNAGLLRSLDYLVENGLRIHPSYANTHQINLGKIGHWVSYLSYLDYLQEHKFDFGVWIEDDSVLPDNFKHIVFRRVAKQIRSKYCVYRMGDGNTADLIRGWDCYKIPALVRATLIDEPIDRYFYKYKIWQPKNQLQKLLSGPLVTTHNFPSSTLNTQLVPIPKINMQIDSRQSDRNAIHASV